ncbi:MAG: FadR family transcriptional regulator [Planctomycetes bacterium]|nr:FadR family transcriptional regulator [Planctomycetota bacterium]
MALGNISSEPLAERVEAAVLEHIRSSHLQVGDALPGELEFAMRLGVSRTVVREAFSRLRMLGVLESRKKRGIVLREPDPIAGFERVLHLPMLGEAGRHQLFELRLVIEMGLADFVCARVTEELIGELESIVQGEEAEPANPSVAVACDVAFHATLYRARDNPLLARFHGLLNEFFSDRTEMGGINPRRFEDPKCTTHRHLLETLRTGDAKKFRHTMHQHLSVHFNRLLKGDLK